MAVVSAGTTVVGLDTVLANLGRVVSDFEARRHRAAEEIVVLLEGWAKSHHPWHPESGATDLATIGYIEEETREYALVALTAGMDYDVFLELAREGKWAWLVPAVQACRDKITEIVRRNLSR